MTRDRYEIAPIFGVRPAGVPFDVLERLGTPALAVAARHAIDLETSARAAVADALARLPEIEDRGVRERVWKRLKNVSELAPRDLAAYPWLASCDGAIRAFHAAGLELDDVIAREYRRVHDQISREAARELPDFLIIETDADAIDRLTGPMPESTSHNSQDRKNDRTLALYLQRVCAKNDTVSRFGPVAWGTIVPGDGARIRPVAGVAGRQIDVELWVVKGLIDHINADPEVKPEIRPRLHPHGCFEGNAFHRLDEDRVIALSEAERALAERCDGSVAAHQLDAAALARLVEHGVVIGTLEPMARDLVPLASLAADIAAWRPGPLRDRWQARLDAVARLADRFAADPSVAGRRQVLTEVRDLLAELEIDRPENRRTLYAARNPIIENCYQAGDITLGSRAVDQLVGDAWPWFELFRDAVSLAGARGFHRMHELVRAAPRRNGVLSYSTLCRVARQSGPSIDDDSLGTAVSAATFADLKRELAEELAGRADAPEWELTASDCAVLRRHQFPLVGELTYPSADLQIIADSPEAAEAGRMQWLIAELHTAPVLLQHSTYWCCPDKPSLARELEKTVDGRPFLVRESGRGIPVHASAAALMDVYQRPIYIGTGRCKPSWHAVRPADAEVIVDEEACDIRLQTASGEDLGSIVHTVRMISAIHPFFPLELAPHTPRLRIGNVIVQRRSWHVESAAVAEGKSTGVSAAFVSAIERLRAERGIPRWVFVRPSPGALRDIGLLTRDKDNKPLFVDLESVVFLDILERRLRKYRTLVVTEMLPTPEQMVWRTEHGRYSFEIRTNVVPRQR